MVMNRRKPKPVNQEEMHSLIPAQMRSYRLEENGLVSILIPKFTGWLSSRILQPYVKHPYLVLSLDELGSATWLQCDGKKTVDEIIRSLKEKFGEKIHPAEERISMFFLQLNKDNLIGFKETNKS